MKQPLLRIGRGLLVTLGLTAFLLCPFLGFYFAYRPAVEDIIRWRRLADPPAKPLQIVYLASDYSMDTDSVRVWAADNQVYTCTHEACVKESFATPSEAVARAIYSHNGNMVFFQAARGQIYACTSTTCETAWWAEPPGETTELSYLERSHVVAWTKSGESYKCSEQSCENFNAGTNVIAPDGLPPYPPGEVLGRRDISRAVGETDGGYHYLLMDDGSLWYWYSGSQRIFLYYLLVFVGCSFGIGVIISGSTAIALLAAFVKRRKRNNERAI